MKDVIYMHIVGGGEFLLFFDNIHAKAYYLTYLGLFVCVSSLSF